MSDDALHAKDLIKQRLPDLRVGPGKEENRTLYQMAFAGALEEWPDFEEHVWRACRKHSWLPCVLAHQSTDDGSETYLPTREMVAVGDQHGVERRFGQHIGQVMSGVLESQEMDLVLGGFKWTTSDYDRVPGIACFDGAGLLKAVGDIKTPWAREHNLEAALRPGNEEWLRELLG